MKEVVLNAVDGDRKIVLRVRDEESCAVCGGIIGDGDWNKVVAAGDPSLCVVAHVDHFKRPGSRGYERSIRKFAEAVAQNLENARS